MSLNVNDGIRELSIVNKCIWTCDSIRERENKNTTREKKKRKKNKQQAGLFTRYSRVRKQQFVTIFSFEKMNLRSRTTQWSRQKNERKMIADGE